jgi:hypothetical protein
MDAVRCLRCGETRWTFRPASLARLLADEQGTDADDVRPWIAASAMMGVHRALLSFSRRRVLEGARHPRLSREVRAQADRAFALLEHGLGDYAVKHRD